MDNREQPPNSRYWNPIWELTLARLREFYREPAAIFWVYGFPLIMVLTLGIAFRSRPAETVRVDFQAGSGAEQAMEALRGDPRFDAAIYDATACRRRLRIGKTDLVVVDQGSQNTYEYFFDPTKPAGVLARNSVDDALQRAAGRTDAVPTKDRPITEPGGRYVDFLIPGLLGMGIMGGGLWGVGFAIVNLRLRKLLKRFLATPMKRSHFLASIIASRVVFTIPEVLVVLLFARYVFDVVIFGHLALVIMLICLGSLEFAGIGLLVASRARTAETASGLMNLVMMPMWIGSGVFFSVERFPDVVQPVISVLPLTPVISSLRAVMLEGAGLAALGQEIAIILVWGVVTFSLALKLFRWN